MAFKRKDITQHQIHNGVVKNGKVISFWSEGCGINGSSILMHGVTSKKPMHTKPGFTIEAARTHLLEGQSITSMNHRRRYKNVREIFYILNPVVKNRDFFKMSWRNPQCFILCDPVYSIEKIIKSTKNQGTRKKLYLITQDPYFAL